LKLYIIKFYQIIFCGKYKVVLLIHLSALVVAGFEIISGWGGLIINKIIILYTP